MYAVIKTGGKQYRVAEGDVINVEKLGLEAGEKVKFENVLIMGEGADIQVGTPYLDAAVFGEVIENGKADKVVIYKYKAKKDYRKKQGHRQPYTAVEITGIGTDKPRAKKAEPAPAAEAAPAEKVEAPAETADNADEKGVSMSMKKDELVAYAKENDIEIDEKATKQVIIDTINAAK
ncbi:MAG: 50S ribosomal protein L21 [Eubacteriaceae bacterium]|nr:50S ribosomal protein L21 [Eubacteriaceae bacterium]